jgi:hypothetical protein
VVGGLTLELLYFPPSLALAYMVRGAATNHAEPFVRGWIPSDFAVFHLLTHGVNRLSKQVGCRIISGRKAGFSL